MKTTICRWRPALRVLALALAIAVVPVPALAQEKSPPSAKPGIQASMDKAVANTLATQPKPARVQAARSQGTTAPPAKASFFKSPAGIAVLGILAAGGGYAIYSVAKQGYPSPPFQ